MFMHKKETSTDENFLKSVDTRPTMKSPISSQNPLSPLNPKSSQSFMSKVFNSHGFLA